MPFPDHTLTWPAPPEPDPYRLPDTFQAGDTFELRVRSGIYPASEGWSLTLAARGLTVIDINSTEDGQDYVLTATKATTALWSPGRYTVTVYAVSATERHEIASGYMEVLKNLSAQTANVDLRSHARKCLDRIEALLEQRATSDVLHSQIDNTMFTRLTPTQLLEMRDYYATKVRAEETRARVKAGRASGRNIFVRFTRP